MAYSDVRDNQSSRKFSLIRLEPARYINDDLTDNGDGTYSITLSNFVISKIEENGVALTLSTSTLAQGEYSFNESTGELTIYPNNAPSSTNAIIAYYYLFYTSQRARTVSENPEDNTTSTRDWLARVRESPEITQSIVNIENGFFEISSSQLTIINDNQEFNTYLSDNDSLYNKEVRVWFCIDSVDNIKKAFIGKITNFSLGPREILLNIEDNLSAVSQPATMGDGRQYTYWGEADWPNMQTEKAGTVIPFFFGRTSRYQTLSNSKSDLANAVKLDPESLYFSVCTDFNSNIQNTNNREFGCGRIPGYGLQQTIHSIQTSYHGSSNYTRFTIATHSSIFVGDNGLVDGPSAEYGQVIYVDSTNSYVYCEKMSAQNYTTFSLNGLSVVVTQTSVNYYPIEGKHYNVLTQSTDAENSYVYFQFVNAFETTLGGMSTLDPTQHSVRFRIKPNHDYATHGECLKYMLSKVGGISSNSTSFSTADSDLVTNVAFSMPNFDEIDFDRYTKYFGDVLSSTFGYLRLNEDFEVEYKLFNTPSDSTSITNHDILFDEYNVVVDYKDVVNEIIAYNPHYNSIEHSSQSGVSAKSVKAKYLHGIDKTIRFRHVLESMSTRLTTIFNSRKERKARYTLKTKTKNLDSILGEDFNLEYKVISADSTRSMKLVSISKAPNGSRIVLDDLIGI